MSFLILEEKLSCFPKEHDVDCGLVLYVLIWELYIVLICSYTMLSYISSIPILLRVFIMNRVEFCQIIFPHLLKWSYDFFNYSFINVMYHTETCIESSYLIIVYDPFNVQLRFNFLVFCWEIFCIYINKGYNSLVFLFCPYWLWDQDNAVLIKWVWKCSHLFSIWKSFK